MKWSFMKSNQSTEVKKRQARRRGKLYSFAFLSFAPTLTYAAFVDTLQNTLNYLTGSVGTALATIAIVGAGIGCFGLGKVPKGYLIAIVVGIGLIFGATGIINVIHPAG